MAPNPAGWAFEVGCVQQYQGLAWSPIPFITLLMTLPAYVISSGRGETKRERDKIVYEAIGGVAVVLADFTKLSWKRSR